MKRITLRADESLIKQARLVARSQHTTLSAAFREWLVQYVAQAPAGYDFDTLMKRLRHVQAGRAFRRDEMNQR